MLHTSTQKLIQKLCELTEGGDIAWKEGADGRCVLETEGYRVELEGEPPSVRLVGTDGRELEKAETADLALAWPGGNGTYATHVSDMARRASRIARGAEHAIAKILSSLSAPPQRASAPVELEPMPAAIEFEPQIERKPVSTRAGESAASLAAINADMAQGRRQPQSEPPQSVPKRDEPKPGARESDTSIEASPPDAEPAIAAAEEELPLEESPPPSAKAETTAVQERAFPHIASDVPPPRFAPAQSRTAFGAAPAVSAPSASPSPPQPAPQQAGPRPSPLFVTGFSAVTKPPAPAPAPQLAAQAAPQPVPAPAPPKPREPEMTSPPPRTGADIYKPWSKG